MGVARRILHPHGTQAKRRALDCRFTLESALVGKRVAVVQSNYIPWKGGYFDLIHSVNEFILYINRRFIDAISGLLGIPTKLCLNKPSWHCIFSFVTAHGKQLHRAFGALRGVCGHEPE